MESFHSTTNLKDNRPLISKGTWVASYLIHWRLPSVTSYPKGQKCQSSPEKCNVHMTFVKSVIPNRRHPPTLSSTTTLRETFEHLLASQPLTMPTTTTYISFSALAPYVIKASTPSFSLLMALVEAKECHSLPKWAIVDSLCASW